MNNSIKVKKVRVKDVLNISMNLYRDNFRLFFKLNAIGILILLVTGNFIRLQGIFGIIELDLIIGFIGMIIAYVGIYYNLRVTIALILTIKDRYNNRKVSIKDSYKRAKSYTWSCIGVLFLLGLMMCIPVLIMMIGFSKVDSIVLKIMFLLVGIIPTLYLIVNYGLALYIRIFKPGLKNYFAHSKKLVKSYFWEVLVIFSIPFILQVPIYISRYVIDESELGVIQGFIYSNLGLLLSLFIGPFIIGVMVITYLKLDNKLK